MYFGGALALIGVGAVLAFAIEDRLGSVDLEVVGYILMVVGVLGIVLTIAMNSQRGRRRNGASG